MNYCNFNYKTTLPKEANAPSVSIYGDIPTEYLVSFNIENNGDLINISDVICKTNETVYVNHTQCYRNWVINVYENNKLIIKNVFDTNNKVVFIKMDAHALGDNIAWIPYVEEFRKLRKCTVICSTFYNDLFKNIYPDILFVAPNTNVDNVYTQYYIGATHKLDTKYSPICVDEVPLQHAASSVLGLPLDEIKPPLEKQLRKNKNHKKYVCISEFASGVDKHWKYEGGWQIIVDHLNLIGYDVLVISKEMTELKNIKDLTGNKPLIERAQLLYNADFFIGLSSGLSWLSWGVGTHTFLISDVTQMKHEFTTNVSRISANPSIDRIQYDSPNITNPNTVIKTINEFLKTKS
jgi:autotransporter strand-loop-strand O-heptosyltransferase